MDERTNDHRAALIRGLRDLADWLDAHPDLPIHPYSEVEVLVHAGHLPGINNDDTAATAEVHRIADLMGVPAIPGDDDIEATVSFGRARYRVLHIARSRMARYAAERTYHGAVEPDLVGAS